MGWLTCAAHAASRTAYEREHSAAYLDETRRLLHTHVCYEYLLSTNTARCGLTRPPASMASSTPPPSAAAVR
jgi:hypothetical protein